jgi:hypothetical protein
MKFPCLKEAVAVCLMLVGVSCVGYSVVIHHVDWELVSLNPPIQMPVYWDEVVYPYRTFGLFLTVVGLLVLLVLHR